MSLYHAPNKYEFNIKNRLSRRKSPAAAIPIQEDLTKMTSRSCISESQETEQMTTNKSNSTSTTIISASFHEASHQRVFMERCLLIRALHEQCGHIYWLSLHESPCKIPHHGIVSSTSHLAQQSCCGDMAQHLVIKHSSCEECKPVAIVGKKGVGWFRKGKEKCVESEVRGSREGKLTIKRIVERRDRWRGEVEDQRKRIETRMVKR